MTLFLCFSFKLFFVKIKIIYFNENDEIHVDFIQSSVNILSTAFGQQYCTDREEIKKMVRSAKVKEFKPANVKINTNNDDQAPAQVSEDDEEVIERIINELRCNNMSFLK